MSSLRRITYPYDIHTYSMMVGEYNKVYKYIYMYIKNNKYIYNIYMYIIYIYIYFYYHTGWFTGMLE